MTSWLEKIRGKYAIDWVPSVSCVPVEEFPNKSDDYPSEDVEHFEQTKEYEVSETMPSDNAGTLGTPGLEKCVHGLEKKISLESGDLSQAGHIGHTAPPARTMSRKTIGRKLKALLGVAIPRLCTRADWDKLEAIPGWAMKLTELENAYDPAWRDGSDCTGLYLAVRDHWISGLKMIGVLHRRRK